MSFAPSIQRACSRALQLADKSGFAGPLLARITVGVLFMSTGWGKVHHLDKVAQFFAELHIPAPAFQATLVSYVELLGGALVLIGLGTRLAALPLIASMVVALITAKSGEIHGLPDLFGLVEWTYLALLAWLALAGAGRISLDQWLFRPRIARAGEVTRGGLAEKAA